VDYRLARYRRRAASAGPGAAFECKLLRNPSGDPILKLPRERAEVPTGEHDVRLPDGSVWTFRFAREFCNVAREVGRARNQLPDLLRGWFGPAAGAPGTSFHVRMTPSPDGLWIEPVTGSVVALEGQRDRIACYPELRAAAGHAVESPVELDRSAVALPLAAVGPELFAVRVAGDSMDGGQEPLRHGDWAVLRLARGAPAGSVEGRVVLVETADGPDLAYQLKRLLRSGNRWELASDNPAGPRLRAREPMSVIARLERGIRPESLAPALRSLIPEGELASAFGIDALLPRTGRYGGHLFAFIESKDLLVSPTELALPAVDPRPAETVFALAHCGSGAWRYLGVGRRGEDSREVPFLIPEVDFETWRDWGQERGASRTLAQDALGFAEQIVALLVDGHEPPAALERPGGDRRAFVRGRAPGGGVRIDGGPGGFAARTVSLTDLAWVVMAVRDVERSGGLLDEARVNRVRYLEGTPRGSTRWIDTGWAIAAYAAVRDRLGSPSVERSRRWRVRDADGRELDASFRIERARGELGLVFESRGGKAGSAAERNRDYGAGLELLLARLGRARVSLLDVRVESDQTQDLPEEERRVVLEGRPYPVTIDDPAALRQALGAAQARIGRRPGAKGSGNRTRRLRLVLGGDDLTGAVEELAERLAGVSG